MCASVHTFYLQGPLGRVGHVQTSEPSIGRVRVRTYCKEVDISVVMRMIGTYPRDLLDSKKKQNKEEERNRKIQLNRGKSYIKKNTKLNAFQCMV